MRPIPGHPGYFATSRGSIFSRKPGRLFKLTPFKRGRRGHLGVNLSHNGKYVLHSVHRLIAATFIGEPPSARHLVMHLDDDPTNNDVTNLAYGLPSENSAQMTSRDRQAKGERVGGAKLTTGAVLSIRSRLSSGEPAREIAREFNMSSSTICDIKNRKIWRHI